MKTEYGVFRKDGKDPDRPLECRTFTNSDRAARYMQTFLHWDAWLEVHERQVTEWEVSK